MESKDRNVISNWYVVIYSLALYFLKLLKKVPSKITHFNGMAVYFKKKNTK